MTARKLLKKLTNKKESLKAQISSLEEKELTATLNDDNHAYFAIAAKLGDLEDYYEQLVIAINIIEDFIQEV